MTDPEHDNETLYLVRETKGGATQDDLRPDERRKIECGHAHFVGALGVGYKTIRPPFNVDCLP